MSKWRKRIANVRFAGKTRQTLSAFCLKISEHEDEKEAVAKRQLLLFFRMFALLKQKHFYCSNNIPLNQYSVNSKAEIFEVKK